jgi:predicted amidophosphoribosyltransferase
MIRGLEWFVLCIQHERECPACKTVVDRKMEWCPNCVARIIWEEHHAEVCEKEG